MIYSQEKESIRKLKKSSSIWGDIIKQKSFPLWTWRLIEYRLKKFYYEDGRISWKAFKLAQGIEKSIFFNPLKLVYSLICLRAVRCWLLSELQMKVDQMPVFRLALWFFHSKAGALQKEKAFPPRPSGPYFPPPAKWEPEMLWACDFLGQNFEMVQQLKKAKDFQLSHLTRKMLFYS